jgi:hypothetical protein
MMLIGISERGRTPENFSGARTVTVCCQTGRARISTCCHSADPPGSWSVVVRLGSTRFGAARTKKATTSNAAASQTSAKQLNQAASKSQVTTATHV